MEKNSEIFLLEKGNYNELVVFLVKCDSVYMLNIGKYDGLRLITPPEPTPIQYARDMWQYLSASHGYNEVSNNLVNTVLREYGTNVGEVKGINTSK